MVAPGTACPGPILHNAGDFTGSGLGIDGRRGDTPRARDDKADGKRFPASHTAKL
jgi:hypothetical protein